MFKQTTSIFSQKRINFFTNLMRFLLVFASLTLVVYANPPGTLDTTFGSNGAAITNVSTADDAILAVAIQSDSKIVVVGFSEKPAQFTVARYNTNGSLDTSFGTGGIVKTAFTVTSFARAVAIQSDGKIVVGGDAGQIFALTRYTTSGQLDTTFGNQGKVLTAIGNVSGISGIAIQSDGKIIAAGYTEKLADFAVARYTSNGSLDTTFGSGGVVITDFFGEDDRATSIKLQSDGKIVVAGSSNDADLFTNFAIARYNTDGSLDTTFNGSGTVTTLTNSGATALGIQSDGKIVVTGAAEDIYLARYNADGSLDNSFGTNGIVTTNIGGNSDNAYALTLDAAGGILVAGSTIFGGNEDFVVAKYQSSGSLDTTFDGGDGIVITSLGSNSDIGHAISLQQNGGIIVGGSTGDFGAKDFAVVRYIGLQPTAALAYIRGRVTDLSGYGINRVRVTLTDNQGITRSVQTNPFGYYGFSNLPIGQSYVISLTSKGYSFTPSSVVINLMEDTEANFVSN